LTNEFQSDDSEFRYCQFQPNINQANQFQRGFNCEIS